MLIFIRSFISKFLFVIFEILMQSSFHYLPIPFLVLSKLRIFHFNIEVDERAPDILNLILSIKVKKIIVQILISICIFLFSFNFINQRMPGNKECVESSLLLLLISARTSSNCIKEDFQLFLDQLLIFFPDRNLYEFFINVFFDLFFNK